MALALDTVRVAHGPDHSQTVNAMSHNGKALAQGDNEHHADVAVAANAAVGLISRFAKTWNVLSSAGNTDSDKKAKKKAKKAAHKEKQAEEKKGMQSTPFSPEYLALMFICLYDVNRHSLRKRGQRPRRPARKRRGPGWLETSHVY